MNKLATTIVVAASVANGLTMFDDDHDFMKGFETGIMMRRKENKVEEFGCVVPDNARSQFNGIFDTVGIAMNAVKPFLPDDLDIENGFNMA